MPGPRAGEMRAICTDLAVSCAFVCVSVGIDCSVICLAVGLGRREGGEERECERPLRLLESAMCRCVMSMSVESYRPADIGKRPRARVQRKAKSHPARRESPRETEGGRRNGEEDGDGKKRKGRIGVDD